MPRKKKAEPSTTPSEDPKPKKAAVRAPRTASARVPKAPGAKKAPAPRAAKAPRRPKATDAEAPIHLSALKRIPRRGETQMVAFIRDPQCLFTYWEVSPQDVEEVKKKLMEEYKDSSMVLMVFKSGAHGEVELLYEVKVEPGERNRYLELKEPGGRYFVQVARKTASGRIIPIVRSNLVVTGEGSGAPPSPEPQWQPPAGMLEYFSQEEGTLTAAPPVGISSAEWARRKKAREARYAASRTN